MKKTDTNNSSPRRSLQRCVRRVIGDCVLICGDSLSELQKIETGSVDMVFTDPPYGHNNNDGDLIHNREKALGKPAKQRTDARPIANDGAEANGLFLWACHQYARVLRGGCCCCCCCGGGGPDPQFARWALWMDMPLQFLQMIVWDKGPMGMGWQYRRSYETVLVAKKRGGKTRWHDDSHRIENIIRPASGIRKIIPKADQHPTQKPVGLAEHFIRLHSQPGDVVLDPFMGTGSTGVAAARTGRRFIGIEIDRDFYREACVRIAVAYKTGTPAPPRKAQR